jgi:hypothetical protein
MRFDEEIFKLNKRWHKKLEMETATIYGNTQHIRNNTDEKLIGMKNKIETLNKQTNCR